MLQPAAALPCHWLHPIQASEANTPLAESCGVCLALLTRIGSDVSKAVRLTAQSISEQSRPKSEPESALCLGVRLGLRVGPARTRAQHGPTALRWWPRRDGSSRRDLACCWGGLPGLPVPLVRRAAALRRGLAGLRPTCGEAGAQDGGASRCRFGQAPPWRLGRVGGS
jgi:hypothetical protein